MTIFDDLGDPDRGARATFFTRVAHALPFIAVLLLAYCALRWFNVNLGWAGLLFVPLLVASMLIVTFHTQMARLCLKCMQMAKPDDPVRVQRRRTRMWLRFDHLPSRYWWALWLTAVGFLYVMRTINGWVPDTQGWAYVPGDLFIVATYWARWKHHRYRPWCPYCKPWEDDGGPREPSPTPDPTGVKTA